ncbi:MAG: hypothetical protein ABIJ56_18800 [Pseudomonadota bacterium]
MDSERIKSIIAPIIESYDVEITDFSFAYVRSGVSLRVNVDRKISAPAPLPYPGSTIDLKTLERISKEITAAFEAYSLGGKNFSLEVSSPGLDRPIPRPEEYRFFVGHELAILLKYPLNGRRRFKGRLAAVEEEEGRAAAVIIESADERWTLEVAGIEKARICPQFPDPKKKTKKTKKKKKGK